MRLVDWQIDQIVQKDKVIEPYEPTQITKNNKGEKVISYGLSSAGYDIRISDEFKLFDSCGIIDPKNFNNDLLIDHKTDCLVMPPHSYALGRSIELFRIPRDIVCTCLGKSTYARSGIIVNVTPLEPGWRGFLTIEISNPTQCSVKVYANEGIAQLQFDLLKGPPKVSYADRKGKYQDQVGIVPPRML